MFRSHQGSKKDFKKSSFYFQKKKRIPKEVKQRLAQCSCLSFCCPVNSAATVFKIFMRSKKTIPQEISKTYDSIEHMA